MAAERKVKGDASLFLDLSEARRLEKKHNYINLSIVHQGTRIYAKWLCD